jgi:hypothetical protein
MGFQTPHCSADPEAECSLDMSPMIDMVFLLLIFLHRQRHRDHREDRSGGEAARSRPTRRGRGRQRTDRGQRPPDGTFTAEDFNHHAR